MISIDFSNLYRVGKHGLTTKQVDAQKKHLRSYLKKIHKRDQGFYSIVDDKQVITDIAEFVDKTKKKYDSVVILGMGGSTLGPICLQEALTHYYGKVEKGMPQVHIVDNIDPMMIRELFDVLELKKTLFIVITKSGGTPETLANYLHARKHIENTKLDPKKHFVFITDPEKGFLRKVANKEHIPSFAIPSNVGGRFSVLTPVGLLPAAFMGIDIKKLLAGAADMRDNFESTSYKKNLPFQMALVQYLLDTKRGKVMNVMYPYAQKLYRFADWYRQLLAESIGKAVDEQGKAVHVGITPVNALGATDQHSQSQLYNEGPNDKLFMFIAVENFGKKVQIPMLHKGEETIAFLKGVSFGELLNVEREATTESYTKNKRPNLTITLDKIDAYNLGALFMLFEGATAFLGEFYGINAFNQPGVELSKKLTKKYLLEK